MSEPSSQFELDLLRDTDSYTTVTETPNLLASRAEMNGLTVETIGGQNSQIRQGRLDAEWVAATENGQPFVAVVRRIKYADVFYDFSVFGTPLREVKAVLQDTCLSALQQSWTKAEYQKSPPEQQVEFGQSTGTIYELLFDDAQSLARQLLRLGAKRENWESSVLSTVAAEPDTRPQFAIGLERLFWVTAETEEEAVQKGLKRLAELSESELTEADVSIFDIQE